MNLIQTLFWYLVGYLPTAFLLEVMWVRPSVMHDADSRSVSAFFIAVGIGVVVMNVQDHRHKLAKVKSL